MTFLKQIFVGGAMAVLMCSVSVAAEDKPAEPDVESATHKEIEPIPIKFESLGALCLHVDGNLLAGDAGAKHVKVIDPDGKQVATIKLPFGPESIDVAADGTIYCGGEGQLTRIDAKGAVIKTVSMPKQDKPSGAADSSRWAGRTSRVSGIAATDKSVFVAYGSSWSMRSTSKLFRFSRDLEKPELILEDIRGCCQRCDIVARDSVVYIAENTRHRIVRIDCDGKELSVWGSRGRTGPEGFGSCCNPMNLGFDAAGSLYTSESGLGRIKRYSTDGKLLDLTGYVATERFTRAGHTAASCSNIAIAVTPDGKRIYVMDYKENLIRVLQKKDGL